MSIEIFPLTSSNTRQATPLSPALKAILICMASTRSCKAIHRVITKILVYIIKIRMHRTKSMAKNISMKTIQTINKGLLQIRRRSFRSFLRMNHLSSCNQTPFTRTLNCHHDFCLTCVAYRYLKTCQGPPFMDGIIEINCELCGETTELDPASAEAVESVVKDEILPL